MDTIPKFEAGDLVHRIQDIEAARKNNKFPPEYVVVRPHVPTDMKRVGGEPVNFYVTLKGCEEGSTDGNYHQQNLVLNYDYDPERQYRGV